MRRSPFTLAAAVLMLCSCLLFATHVLAQTGIGGTSRRAPNPAPPYSCTRNDCGAYISGQACGCDPPACLNVYQDCCNSYVPICSVPPMPPGGLTVSVSAANAQAFFTWAAPSWDGGSAITGYTVTSTPGGLTCALPLANEASPEKVALACTMTGLTYGTLYSFAVTATNSAGTSGPSVAVSAKMPSQQVKR